MPSTLLPPPVASTVPSGSEVSVWNARRNAIGAVDCHPGVPAVMSSTYVVAAARAVDTPTSAAVPDFITLPGWYITALCPSNTRESTTLHVCVDRFSTRVGIAVLDAPAARTRPSGSTNMCGYSGNVRFALVSSVQLSVSGS